MTYKLVRDKIPRIMANDGHDVNVRVVKNLGLHLLDKLQEETNEFFEDPCVEELADVFEVLGALMREFGISEEELHQARRIKFAERGGFEIGIMLGVED